MGWDMVITSPHVTPSSPTLTHLPSKNNGHYNKLPIGFFLLLTSIIYSLFTQFSNFTSQIKLLLDQNLSFAIEQRVTVSFLCRLFV